MVLLRRYSERRYSDFLFSRSFLLKMKRCYDYIIIGGGIAGLYANYKLYNTGTGLLLERNSYFGGRAYEIDFHGTLIKLGAGIMADHNKHLVKWW